MKNKKIYKGHGEVLFLEIDSIPKEAKKVIPNSSMIAGKGLIVGESETSGNHHCVEMKEGVEFFESNGVLYMKNTEPTQAFCSLDRARHPEIELEPKVWKIKIQKEFDLLEIFRTPYRIDHPQKLYYFIDSFEQLFDKHLWHFENQHFLPDQ